MEPGTIHRGIGNTDNVTRPMLCVELLAEDKYTQFQNQSQKLIENQDTSILYRDSNLLKVMNCKEPIGDPVVHNPQF